MNQELWNRILAFDLDNPPSEYGFSTRLAKENFWTQEFTNQAILEYKKFMYLAATSKFMVSPSEIIDVVWHQHLIFTKSYQDFCKILGKQIQHIPSTHNREDYEKFFKAKERTINFYEKEFGLQPKNIWSFHGMFESLNLIKAKFKLRTFIIYGILTFICMLVPAYFLLKPIYIQIDNPIFIFGLIFLTILTLFALDFYNKYKLEEIVSSFDPTSFVFDLQPFELVYLKTQKLNDVINGTINELIHNGVIKINDKNKVELVKNKATVNNSQLQATTSLKELGTSYYTDLSNKLVTKPIFWNIQNSLDAFRKYFNKSKKFGNIFYFNFVILNLLVLFSFTRIITGILRDKPVFLIVNLTIVLVIVTVVFLQRLTKQISTITIPDYYKNQILPTRQIENNWQWSFFLLGNDVLTVSFVPIVNNVHKTNNSAAGGNSCGSNSGSSCGSSCSSCGGCGGCGS